MQEKIILPTDSESAELVTVTGWLSRTGWISRNNRFYSDDEQAARYDGATHLICRNCQSIHAKNSWCKKCRHEKEIEHYNSMDFKEWDGETPLYSEAFDEYFYDDDGIECFIEDHPENITVDDLRLVICELVQPSQISDDYWEDIYPEDYGFEECASQKVKKALEELNKVLAEEKPWSWHPGEFRTEYKPETEEDKQ